MLDFQTYADVAKAEQEGQLVFYCHENEAGTAGIMEGFSKDFPKIKTSYVRAQTGAVYSKSEANLKKAAEQFHVGNLYLNRKCTGALVGGHPFGGFNMSGTDSKTGGFDYLMLFLQAKSIGRKV